MMKKPMLLFIVNTAKAGQCNSIYNYDLKPDWLMLVPIFFVYNYLLKNKFIYIENQTS